MQDVFDLSALSVIEVALLIDELKELDPYVEQRVKYVESKASVDTNTALEYVINDTPALWAKVFVNWTARDYQLPILDQSKKARRLVLRLGRRLLARLKTWLFQPFGTDLGNPTRSLMRTFIIYLS